MFLLPVVQFSRSFLFRVTRSDSFVSIPFSPPIVNTFFKTFFTFCTPPVCSIISAPALFPFLCAFSGFDYLFFYFILYKNDLVFIKNSSFSYFYFDFFRFFLLEFKKYFVILFIVFCARSSVDRAPASGAGCVGSIPVGRTKRKEQTFRSALFSIYRILYFLNISFLGF